MGTWNNKPFGNDTALDWFSSVKTSKTGYTIISTTLQELLRQQETDSIIEEEAMAAVAIIAAASDEDVTGCNADIRAWIISTGFSPDSELKKLAVTAIDCLTTASELRDQWQEAKALTSWQRQLTKLRDKLSLHLHSDGPSRTPKRPALPRSVSKLVDYYLDTKDHKAKVKLVEKLTAIDDPNVSGSETGYDLAINIAAKLGFNDLTEQLIAKGANPNLRSSYGYTALTLAAANDHPETVALLLENSAELFLDYPEYGEDGIIAHRMKCVAMLSAARKASPTTIETLERYGASIYERDLNGEGLLFKAAESGNIALLAYLISRGLDINLVKDKTATFQGETALHYAVRANQFEAVEVLINSGADINLMSYNLDPNNPWCDTPLDYCNARDNPDLTEYLKSKGAKTARELTKTE